MTLSIDRLALAFYANAAFTLLFFGALVVFEVLLVGGVFAVTPAGAMEIAITSAAMGIVLLFAGVLVVLYAGLFAVAGFGLRARRPWSRTWGLVAGTFAIMNAPFGTLVGVLAFLTLLDQGVAAELENQGKMVDS